MKRHSDYLMQISAKIKEKNQNKIEKIFGRTSVNDNIKSFKTNIKEKYI